MVPKEIVTTPYQMGNLGGIRYIQEDNAGRKVFNLILAESPTSTRIFSVIYLSNEDEATTNSVIDPVLATVEIK